MIRIYYGREGQPSNYLEAKQRAYSMGLDPAIVYPWYKNDGPYMDCFTKEELDAQRIKMREVFDGIKRT